MTDELPQSAVRTLRRLWFEFLDAAQPARPKLHAYCLRLTGSMFDAEDLVQETLLKAFAAIGQGDIAGGGAAPVANLRAYLSRIATNLWIDAQRRGARELVAAVATAPGLAGEAAIVTPAAAQALFARAAPQERAAVVLKDVFDFSLEEIAAILATSVGAVKAALHRGRAKLIEAPLAPPRGQPASPELIDRFVTAFNARDLKALTEVLSERVIYEARGVGGERGREATWMRVNLERPPSVASERALVEGEHVAIGVFTTRDGRRVLTGVSRLEEADGRLSRHVGYYYCPETLRLVAASLGLEAANHGYHQDPETLERMIAGAKLPWAGI